MIANSSKGRKPAEYAEAVQRVLAGEPAHTVCDEYRLMQFNVLKAKVYYAKRNQRADQAEALKLLRPDPLSKGTPIRRCQCGKLTAQLHCHHCGGLWQTTGNKWALA